MPTPLAMRSISLKVGATGATPAQEVNCEVAEVVINDEAGDEERYDVLCPDASYVTNGPNAPTISIRGVQVWADPGLALFLWNSVGQVVDFVYAPFGNAAPSATEPHWVGSFSCNYRPQVGGEVGTFAEVDVEYPIVGSVELVTTAPAADGARRSGKAA